MSKIHERYGLNGLEVQIEAPVEVGRAAGHFWFSTLHPMSPGHLFCEVVRSADVAQGKWPSSLFHSSDGGRSWNHALDIESYGAASLPLSSDSLLFMPYELWPMTPGDKRNARADGTLVESDGRGGYSATPAPMKFLGFPHDLDDYPVREVAEIALLTNGNILATKDGRHLTTLYGKAAGDPKWNVYAVTSPDGGRTWEFLSMVGEWKDVPEQPEGPDESNTARLPDGRLLCVYRVGSGRTHLYHKSYSRDEGTTWTKATPVQEAWSVEPQLVRLENGLILLTGGRPGLFLWVCGDGEGNTWQRVNLAEHHNAMVRDPALRYDPAFCEASGKEKPALSTSYTGMKAVGPDEALVSYDRLGNGWSPAPGPWGKESVVFTVRIRATR
ncbi:MAG: exo-alpha-sialidase [Planctomycetes bacterium]|nr:exo-alpha-sialidase [Planctomycetota bacterium]